MDNYVVKRAAGPVDISVEVPGSKSITNRALLMAAMADGPSVLEGVLFSEDSEHFLKALQALGFALQIDREHKKVSIQGQGGGIPNKSGEIFVGSAGTAARFLAAFLAMGDGSYRLDSSEQMKKRPMRELLEALVSLGAKITFEEEPWTFPMRIEGIRQGTAGRKTAARVELTIDRSSQFLSALLMTAPLCFEELTVQLTGQRNARSYVEMTEQMMKQFGHPGVKRIGESCYQVGGFAYAAREYLIEPDVSAACYFYAMGAVTGGRAVVSHMRRDSLQGDMQFLKILERMGCTLSWQAAGKACMPEGRREECLVLTGPEGGHLKGIQTSFSDFSDQALTMAAIAPYADAPVSITGIAHIRGQESDRVAVICRELARMGIRCEETQDSVTIYPGTPKGAEIETYNDHRVAMAFALTGLRAEGIVIKEPGCCKKTFPEYFQVFSRILP